MKHIKLLPLIMTLLLPACANLPQEAAPTTTSHAASVGVACNTQVDAAAHVKFDQIDKLVASGRNHAALAELQASPMNSIKHWLRYAKLEATTGSMQKAATVFERLGHECGSNAAWHGLGIIELKQGKLIAGLYHLEAAAKNLPSDASAHNDYGYGLLLVGNYQQAIFQLRTAFELKQAQGAARINLATAYMLANDDSSLHDLFIKHHYSKAEIAYAKKMATKLRLPTTTPRSDKTSTQSPPAKNIAADKKPASAGSS